jgi:hypothetical protein
LSDILLLNCNNHRKDTDNQWNNDLRSEKD